jgi:hypothetical protein
MAHEVLSEDVASDESETDAAGDGASEDAVRRPIEPSEVKGLWGWVEQTARIAASIGVAGAAIVGVFEYMSANEDVRRERALTIVQDWQEDGQIDRYTRLQSFVEAKLETTDALPADMPPELLARAYQNLGYNWMVDLRGAETASAASIENDVDRLTLFFSQMETCISADLCNAEVLRAYFGSEARSFWQYFQGYAQLRRENNYPAYGAPVTALISRFGAMEAE